MIVFAVNVHTGGGKVLLDELLASEPFGKVSILFYDERYALPPSIKGRYPQFPTKKSILSRLKAELRLRKYLKSHNHESVLFFGNLPPLLIRPSNAILYLQNCFLLPGVEILTNNIKTFLRLSLEKLILRIGVRFISEVWVQTDWMVERLKKLNPRVVQKKPFLPTMPTPQVRTKDIDIVAVTSYAKHKNLAGLIEALEILDTHLKKKISVVAVLDQTEQTQPIQTIGKHVEIKYVNNITREELFKCYEKSQVAVITSFYESYSLPIYEALHFNLKVICPSLPYTEEVKDRTLRYDVNSPQDLSEKLFKLVVS